MASLSFVEYFIIHFLPNPSGRSERISYLQYHYITKFKKALVKILKHCIPIPNAMLYLLSVSVTS